jgi:mono/diheme cytochrome c family protein
MPWILCLLAGCQQQMASQPSLRPSRAFTFFADGRANRPLPAGTVARGRLRDDTHLFDGRAEERSADTSRAAASVVANVAGNPFGSAALAFAGDETHYVTTFPFPITEAVIRHGKDRFMIYCVVCHDPLGTGHGMVVERGYTPPPSYHVERLRQAPVGHFFDVITRGYGSMPAYRDQVPPRDRWAIIAYIRALQRSQHYPIAELPASLRREWQEQVAAAEPGGTR